MSQITTNWAGKEDEEAKRTSKIGRQITRGAIILNWMLLSKEVIAKGKSPDSIEIILAKVVKTSRLEKVQAS